MPGIKRNTSRFVSISDGVKVEILQCKICADTGLQGVLGPRIYGINEVIPTDADNWRQCRDCGRVYPIYEVRGQSEIEVDIEPLKNPFDQLSSSMSTPDFARYPKTRTPRKKTIAKDAPNIYKIKTSKEDDLDNDEEINSLIRQGHKVKRN